MKTSKIHLLFALPLALALILPAIAQEAPVGSQQPAAAATAPQSSAQPASASDQDMSARQPLEPERQGFWGKMNPCARKKYVQKQLTPIRDRVNELDDLTAANAKQIKDVDARAQEGIRQASAQATAADQHAIEAGNRAQQANQTALQASNRLSTVEQVVGNLDQYHPATQTEIRFRPGQTVLSTKAKQALDDMAADLKDQKGYIIEVQGFSPTGGQAGIQSSQAMANSVVRYLVGKNDVPVYRIFVMGMGNAAVPVAENGNGKPAHVNRVEVSLLKNNVDQLAAMNQGNEAMGPAPQGNSSSYQSHPTATQPAPSAQPSSHTNSNSALANPPSPQQ